MSTMLDRAEDGQKVLLNSASLELITCNIIMEFNILSIFNIVTVGLACAFFMQSRCHSFQPQE